MFEFMIRQVVDRYDLDTVEGRTAAMRTGAPIVASIRDPASQNGYARELARLSGADLQDTLRAVQSARRAEGTVAGRRAERGNGSAQQYPGESPAPAAAPVVQRADLTDPTQRTERETLMVLLQLPVDVGPERAARAVQVPFVNPTHAVIRDAIASRLDTMAQPGWVDRVLAEVPEAYAPTVNALAVSTLPQAGDDPGRYARSIVDGLIDRDLLREKAELTNRLARTDPAEAELRRSLQVAMAAIDSERMRLRGE